MSDHGDSDDDSNANVVKGNGLNNPNDTEMVVFKINNKVANVPYKDATVVQSPNMQNDILT